MRTWDGIKPCQVHLAGVAISKGTICENQRIILDIANDLSQFHLQCANHRRDGLGFKSYIIIAILFERGEFFIFGFDALVARFGCM